MSVCVPSLLESAIVFENCEQCVCAWNRCTEGQSYGTLHLATCTYVQSGYISIPSSLLIDKGVIADRGYKEYGREDFDGFFFFFFF